MLCTKTNDLESMHAGLHKCPFLHCFVRNVIGFSFIWMAISLICLLEADNQSLQMFALHQLNELPTSHPNGVNIIQTNSVDHRHWNTTNVCRTSPNLKLTDIILLWNLSWIVLLISSKETLISQIASKNGDNDTTKTCKIIELNHFILV
jgi:hypothetical protein